jgi:hypothetical protein
VAAPRGPHPEEPAERASRRMVQPGASLAPLGASFEAASRRVEARGDRQLQRLNDSEMAPQAFEIAQNGLGNGHPRFAIAGKENWGQQRDLTPSRNRLSEAGRAA